MNLASFSGAGCARVSRVGSEGEILSMKSNVKIHRQPSVPTAPCARGLLATTEHSSHPPSATPC